MTRLLRLCLMLTLAAIVTASCQTAPRSADRGPSIKALSGDAVPPPPGIDGATLSRRRGDQLARAQMTLESIVTALPTPDYLKPSDTPAEPASESDIPLAVQRAYVEGREAWREGRNFDAVQALQRAQRLAPNEPQVLRLLGQIYANSGNRVRGAQLLEQAVRIDPTDVESLVHLAMYAQDQGRFNDAIATFLHAMKLAEADKSADPALRPLAYFYLGNALEREGYDAAAIRQYQLYLELPRHFSRSTAMVRELAFLYRQRGVTWQTVGDLHNRLDQTEQALLAYQQAMELEPSDPIGLMARAMYTHLRRGEPAAARDACLQVVRQAPDQPRTMSLLRYITDVGATNAAFAQELEDIYRRGNRPGTLALTVAAMLPADKATALLRDHLAARPADAQVYRELIKAQWSGKAADADAAVAAIQTTTAAIEQEPGLAREYAQALIAIADTPATIVQRIDSLPEPERQAAALRYLRGSALIRARKPDDAAVDLRAAMTSDARLVDARVELADLLILQGKLDEAGALLDELGTTTDSDVISLRVKVLAQTNRQAEALALLDQQLTADPTNLDLVMNKAGLQLKMNDAVAAERTLQDALNLQPSAEQLYEALFQLYDSQAAPPDAVKQYQRLMRRVLGTIPNSRIARLQRAKLHDARSEFREAEQLLRGLLEERPDDLDALDTLLEVLVRSDRTADADALIEKRLNEDLINPAVLRAAHRHYQRTNNTAKVNDLFERVLLQEPDSPQKFQELAKVYLRSDRPGQAMDMLLKVIDEPMDDPSGFVQLLGLAATKANRADEADGKIRAFIARFPEHEADLLFEWAMVFERRGDRAKSEQMMVELLQKHPDHAKTNNSLGYAWANDGRNLDKAQQMIQSAVDADPNAAYLDSLGWVLYKKGQYEEAVQWLKRSKALPEGDYPVILDHLGDALYRLNRKADAVREWNAAQRALQNVRMTPDDDPELAGIGDRVKTKLEAVQKNTPAPVAPVPGVEDPPPVAPAQDAHVDMQPAEAVAPQD